MLTYTFTLIILKEENRNRIIAKCLDWPRYRIDNL